MNADEIARVRYIAEEQHTFEDTKLLRALATALEVSEAENTRLRDALDWAARGFVAQNHATGLVPSVLKVQAKVRAVLSESQETQQ